MTISSTLFTNLIVSTLFLSSVVHEITGTEQIYVQHAPVYMDFAVENAKTLQPLKTSQLPDLISAAVRFTPSQNYNWKGLNSGNPFKRPKSVVVTEFDGFHDLDLDLKRPKFALQVDAAPGWSYQITADRIYERFPSEKLNLIEIVNDDALYAVKTQYQVLLEFVAVRPVDLENNLFSSKSVLKGKPLGSLNSTNTPDLAFLLDVQLLSEVIEGLPSKKDIINEGNAVDLFWLRFSSVQDLISIYGKDSAQVTEALSIIRDVLERLEKSFHDVYGDDVLLLVLTVDYQHPSVSTRLQRSLLSARETDVFNNITSRNVALDYNEDYPAIFNIILLTMLIICLSVFGIALGIWFMDPGRDSIIYRMTSQRIKKDQ